MFALALFMIGNIGVAGSIVFYESLLPHLAREDELDRVSSAGYAIGYIGGGVLLAINLLMIQRPALFGMPDAGTAVTRCRSPASRSGGWCSRFRCSAACRSRRGGSSRTKPRAAASSAPAFAGWSKRSTSCGATAGVPVALAFLLYNDGIQTMIRMATIYGSQIGIDENAMITALLLTQFIGVPVRVPVRHARRHASAPRRRSSSGSPSTRFISVARLLHDDGAHFFALAMLVGMVQGGTQALSRSLFASMIPRHKSSEFFAFFSVFERYAGVLGPLIFACVVDDAASAATPSWRCRCSSCVGAAILAVRRRRRGRARGAAAEAEFSPCPEQ